MEPCDLEQFSFHFLQYSSAEDQEDTIAAQEKVEGDVNHAEELDDLAREGTVGFLLYRGHDCRVSAIWLRRLLLHIHPVSALLEGDMSVEELLEKYKGAYASDFEVASASDSEASGDEEVETEEEESDAESNTSSSGTHKAVERFSFVSRQVVISQPLAASSRRLTTTGSSLPLRVAR